MLVPTCARRLLTDASSLGRSGVAWPHARAGVWADTGAYLTGRWLGRRRLVEHISPSKTVEGLAGGLVLATVAAGIGAYLIGLDPWHPLVIGPLVGLAAQAGDLAESMLKRAAGRKESGFLVRTTLHPDRVDSFMSPHPPRGYGCSPRAACRDRRPAVLG